MIATIERDLFATDFVVECVHRDPVGKVTLLGDRRTALTLDGLSGSEINMMEQATRLHTRLKMTLVGEIRTAPDLLQEASALARKGDVKGATRLAIEAMQEIARGA